MINPTDTDVTPASAPGPDFARIQRTADQVRAECAVCGAHAFMTPGVPRSGRCGTCGSVDLRRLAA